MIKIINFATLYISTNFHANWMAKNKVMTKKTAKFTLNKDLFKI